jgi:hypothetical protein
MKTNLKEFLNVVMNTVNTQSYWACFGLYPSSCMWKTKKILQRFGDWICLRPQVDGAG